MFSEWDTTRSRDWHVIAHWVGPKVHEWRDAPAKHWQISPLMFLSSDDRVWMRVPQLALSRRVSSIRLLNKCQLKNKRRNAKSELTKQ